jgi:hypothetical protein
MRALLAFYRRKRFYELLRALVAPLLCYGVLALIATHLDRFLFLETPARLWITGVTGGLSLLVGAASLGAFAWRRVSVSRLAYEMERMLPRAVAERLVTLDDILAREAAGQAEAGGPRAALIGQLTGETVALCERTPHAARLARDRRLRRRTGAMALLALVWAALFSMPSYQFPLMLQRLNFPLRNLSKPSFMRLTVTPESPVVGRGGEVVLQVRVVGDIPRLLQQPMRWLGTDASLCLLATATGKVDRLAIAGEARPMSRVQSRLFVASRNDLQESFSYRVRCGDAQTDIRFARVVSQPRATGVSVRVEPPAYTGLKTARFEDLRDPVPAFAGSRVQLGFSADQSPLKAVRLISPQDGKILAEPKPDAKTGTYSHEFVMADPLEMEIVLVNELGFENVERVRVSMTLREDQPPGVRLDYPAGEITVAQGELVPMQAELTDDLGLLEGAIGYQINPDRNAGAPSREIPLPVEVKRLSQSLSATFDLEKADTVPGDDVLLWVRVRDSGGSDERSQPVRLHVTAFAGNENERRRLAAWRLVAQMLATVEPSAADHTVLGLNEGAYEPIVASAAAQGFALSSRAAPESLLEFIEREHYFTDSAESAEDARLLHGVISALLLLPPTPSPHSIESRRTALRKIADDTLPSLLRERMARDLVRRALNLRRETLAAVGATDADERRTRAASDRRVDLLLEALDSAGADLAALARTTPSLLRLDDLLAFTRQISRAGRDLKHADPARQQAAGRILCEQIDGWIGLLLPSLPDWKAQRTAAREGLSGQYEALREEIYAAGRLPRKASSSAAIRWVTVDARMVERSPFLGLGERLAAVAPASAAGVAARTKDALACEASLLSRMAADNEFADWLATARVTPTERRLAAALEALDLAAAAAPRAAAAERLRTLNIDDEDATGVEAAPLPATFGLYPHLPALTGAATAVPEPYDKTLETLAAQTGKLLDALAVLNDPAGAGATAALSSALGAVEAGLTQWEADVLTLSYRLHLDLTYGDPRREQTVRLAAALPSLREALSRYQVFVPPLLSRMRNRLRQSSGPENLAAMSLDLEDLVRSVNALGAGMTRTAKQWRGEVPAGEASGAAREIRLYYTAARMLAEADAPAVVAADFFARQPSAAAIVIEERMSLIRDLRNRLREAGDVLQTGSAANPAFPGAIKQAIQIAGDFKQLLAPFAALDADGVVRASVTEIIKRAEDLIRPGRETGPATLAHDKLLVDELQRKVEPFENQAREMIARNAPAVPSGWWGGPAGVWDDAGRRDAEYARRRTVVEFDRARRAAALGFHAVLTRRDKTGTPLPDAPLTGSLFAWRLLNSSLGEGAVVRRTVQGKEVPHDQLVRWLMNELDETSKALRRADGGARRFLDPTSRWVESAKGYLRVGK